MGAIDPRTGKQIIDRRVTAFQHCYTEISETRPHFLIMTHHLLQHTCMDMDVLLHVGCDGIGEFSDPVCENVPGGVQFTAAAPAGELLAEVYPLRVGNPAPDQSGAAVIHLRCPAGKCTLRFSGGVMRSLHGGHQEYLNAYAPEEEAAEGEERPEIKRLHLDDPDEKTAVFTLDGEVLRTAYPEWGLYGVIKGTAVFSAKGNAAYAEGEDIWLTFGFARTPEEADAFASADPQKAVDDIRALYAQMFTEWKLETPEKDLNDAFMHARLGIESAWLDPIGWVECIHHWPTLWHQEHTFAEEWAGNADRVKRALRTEAAHLLPLNAAPAMCPDGNGRRDWGGDNQFFIRCITHFVRFTGDREFAAEMLPKMEAVLRQTFGEYDATDCGIVSWGTQIGNQEDMESTPGPGSGSGTVAIRMIEEVAAVKEFVGDTVGAGLLYRGAEAAKAAMHARLFDARIGRYAWCEDALGVKRPECAYHSIVYPILFDHLCDEEAVSSLDHLEHRMSGPDGEMYQSNHYGDHKYMDIATWGMQCGSNMQPFAATAYARLGRNDMAVRPLRFVAGRVASPLQRGSFPENAFEPVYGYFSPSAATFAQGVIEGLFGLSVDKTAGVTTLSPCMPDEWNDAALTLPTGSVRFERKGNKLRLYGRIDNGTEKVLRWRLPPCSVKSSAGTVAVLPRCGWFDVVVSLGNAADFDVTLSVKPFDFAVSEVGSVGCGDVAEVAVLGAKLLGIDDRQGLFASFTMSDDGFAGHLRDDLLDPFLPYGIFGQMNFSRRMVFLTLQYKDTVFTWPVSVNVLPPYDVEAALDGDRLTVAVTAATDVMELSPVLFVGGKTLMPEGFVNGYEENILTVTLPAEVVAGLTRGANNASLLIAGKRVPFTFENDADRPQTAVTLPADKVVPPDTWKEIGWLHPWRSHMFLSTPHFYMQGLFDEPRTVSIAGTADFPLGKGFIPFGKQYDKQVIDLTGHRGRKVYLLISAFLTNHNIFTPVVRAEVEAERGLQYYRPVFGKDLCCPGDLDVGFSARCIFGFGTYIPEVGRAEKIRLPIGEEDYKEAHPPAYPQPFIWGDRKATQVCDTVFNTVEIDLGEVRDLKELRLTAIGAESAGGLFGIVVE